MIKQRMCLLVLLAAMLTAATFAARAEPKDRPHADGSELRPAAKPYLRMPPLASGLFPALLSETGAFADIRTLRLDDSMLPYDIAVPFWSDGARKSRAVAIGDGRIKFSPTGEWTFPKGTVFLKTFELITDEGQPDVSRRLETRLLVLDADGGVYGAVYKWRADQSDAELLNTDATETIAVKMANGETRSRSWYYPSRKDCLDCHTANAGGVLGVKTRQMNRDFTDRSGTTDNQLRTWNHLKLFEPGFDERDLPTFAKLAPSDDATRSLEERARSYLDANCAQCHRPGGTVAQFDARYDTPVEKQALIDGRVLIDEGIDRARVISPNDIWRSIALLRMQSTGDVKMPPLARLTVDSAGVQLITEWIKSLDGQEVLAPPLISPSGGHYQSPVNVSLSVNEPGADIRYTLDGSAPGKSDLSYQGPIRLDSPTVVRARVFKDGFTRSITTQETFVVQEE